MTNEQKLTVEQLDSCNDRELDALIVEMITHETTCPWHGAIPADDIPFYSSNISDTERLIARWNNDNQDLYIEVTFRPVGYNPVSLNTEYNVVVLRKNSKEYAVSYKISESLPRAICIAIILAEQEKS